MLRSEGLPGASPLDAEGASLELLYRSHYAWLLRVIRRRYGADQSEDLAQETFARASRYQGREVRNPRALLVQIATRTALEFERRRRVRVPLLDVSEDRAESADDQIQALVLKQVILALPPPLKDTFLLSRFAGLTYEEIAGRLGISVKTVEARMTKAIKLCARALERRLRE